MLELGFGCGNTHNTPAGASARVWKKYFSDNGPGLDLYEVERTEHRGCVQQFEKAHPNICTKVITYLPIYLFTIYLSIVLGDHLSFHIYIYVSFHLSIFLPSYLWCASLSTLLNTTSLHISSIHLFTCTQIFTGDIAESSFLDQIISTTGGRFDIIIDDLQNDHEGHLYEQQRSSFMALWPTLQPGSVYDQLID